MVINIVAFIFMLPLGISYAASSLVGRYIGNGNLTLAKRYASYTVFFNIICTLIILILFISQQHGVATLFTKEEEVVDIV